MNHPSTSASPRVRRFPDSFLWGTGGSAYQIEGAVDTDGRGRSIWDAFSHTPGKVNRGDTGDVACDSYNRTDEDLGLVSALSVGAYRFSLSWSRIQPDGQGAVNQRGIDYYRRLAERLLERDVTPVVTLYHWDLPQALEDLGGWASRDTALRLGEFALIAGEALGDLAGMWITINEPLEIVHQGYRVGSHAPGKRDLALAAAANHHVLLGHGYALRALRTLVAAEVPIGATLDPQPFIAMEPAAGQAVAILDAETNGLYLGPLLDGGYPDQARPHMRPAPELIHDGDMALISAPLDFLGVNYYRPHYVRCGDHRRLLAGETPIADLPGMVTFRPPEVPVTVMDWPVVPEALTGLLERLDRQSGGLPLYITENGCAADDYVSPEGVINDLDRVSYIHGHLTAALDAIEAGVNVAGYFYWSLMDNFEWAFGYGRRFGLYHVDFATQTRTAKRSAFFYAEISRSGQLPPVEALDATSSGVAPQYEIPPAEAVHHVSPPAAAPRHLIPQPASADPVS